MGYDLHITRRKRWPDKGNDVSDKMVAIARHFGATVQGDDGEIYDGGSAPPRLPPLSLGQRIPGWFARVRPQRRFGFKERPR